MYIIQSFKKNFICTMDGFHAKYLILIISHDDCKELLPPWSTCIGIFTFSLNFFKYGL